MQIVRSPRILAAGALVGLVALAAAHAWSRTPGARAATLRATSLRAAVVMLRTTGLGRVLADARGRTLYLYTPDRSGTSACYGKCASLWPPLLTAGKPRAGAGVKSSLLGVTRRRDGGRQVTYAGHPLYRFARDSKPGQATGQGLQGVWWVVSGTGKKVTVRPAVRKAAGTHVLLRTTSLGPVLVDMRGMALYLYTPDRSGASTCYGQCASFWLPLTAHGQLVAGTGVDASLLGTTKRTDGTLQVTYAGHPLYRFAQDVKAGRTSGEDLQGLWYVVSASGMKVEPGEGRSTTTTTSSGYYGKGG
jgi:predicted lipoprotein with Yx(FWY)xxD motif